MDWDRQRERRWVVRGEDGRFVTLGRAVAPTEEKIAAAEAAMHARGVAGRVAVMSGNPWTVARPELMEVRPLAGPAFDLRRGGRGIETEAPAGLRSY